MSRGALFTTPLEFDLGASWCAGVIALLKSQSLLWSILTLNILPGKKKLAFSQFFQAKYAHNISSCDFKFNLALMLNMMSFSKTLILLCSPSLT